jgi:uncharacterized protein (TIGR03435 family)
MDAGGSSGGVGQSAPALDAATVRVNPSHENGRRTVGSASITFRSVTRLEWVASAYGVQEYQIAGPDWIRIERYDVTGKAANPSTPEELMAMLQTMLSERFRVRAHQETKELPVCTVTLGKAKPRLCHASQSEIPECSA